jgi:hypothetical protein
MKKEKNIIHYDYDHLVSLKKVYDNYTLFTTLFTSALTGIIQFIKAKELFVQYTGILDEKTLYFPVSKEQCDSVYNMAVKASKALYHVQTRENWDARRELHQKRRNTRINHVKRMHDKYQLKYIQYGLTVKHRCIRLFEFPTPLKEGVRVNIVLKRPEHTGLFNLLCFRRNKGTIPNGIWLKFCARVMIKVTGQDKISAGIAKGDMIENIPFVDTIRDLIAILGTEEDVRVIKKYITELKQKEN